MSDVAPNNEPSQSQTNGLINALHSIVDVQSKETALKKQELDVRSKEIESNERIAIASIEAQERFHANNQVHFNKHLIHKYIYVAVLVAIVSVFAVVLVMQGAKDLVIEALKLLTVFSAGAFGGFHFGKSKKDTDAE